VCGFGAERESPAWPAAWDGTPPLAAKTAPASSKTEPRLCSLVSSEDSVPVADRWSSDFLLDDWPPPPPPPPKKSAVPIVGLSFGEAKRCDLEDRVEASSSPLRIEKPSFSSSPDWEDSDQELDE